MHEDWQARARSADSGTGGSYRTLGVAHRPLTKTPIVQVRSILLYEEDDGKHPSRVGQGEDEMLPDACEVVANVRMRGPLRSYRRSA